MKVVEATWEMRNLGVHCREITLEPSDRIADKASVIFDQQTEYTVVKVPVACIDMLFRLQGLGFRFIETMTICYHAGQDLGLNRIQQRLLAQLHYHEMERADIDRLYAEVETGMFSTDRVSLDPVFTPEQSKRRYTGWIRDALDHGAKLYKVMRNEDVIGFFSLKRRNAAESLAFLGGLYPAFHTSGLGFSTHCFEVLEGRRQGAKRIITSYSSNNRGAAAIHLSMGHILLEQYYVLVKHL